MSDPNSQPPASPEPIAPLPADGQPAPNPRPPGPDSHRSPLQEIAVVFLRLGSVAFGGPAAHVALMEEEIVKRRRWLSREQLLDLMGVTNLLPGPNSTELAIHIGYERAGWPGLWVAGSCFIAPAMAAVWLLADLYQRSQSLPQLEAGLYGIKPVIIAVILQALWKLGKKALTDRLTWGAGLLSLVGYLLGWNEIGLLVGLGLGVMVWRQHGILASFLGGIAGATGSRFLGPNFPVVLGQSSTSAAASAATSASALSPATIGPPWPQIFLLFLKVGSVLYGSGYVLLAFLQRELVDRRGWLTTQTLMDAIAVGQLTPGPVLTTATFIGYVLGGAKGAIAAT
ncbi:MAG: chromate efflux transporter, partial [Prochlorothrix sp.]